MKKKILVVGGGGREHAICWAINQGQTKHDIFCAPGNAGIAQIAQCIGISSTDTNGLLMFAKENKIDLTIVGGETALAVGIVDEFEKHNQRIVGPTLAASRLESSKIFAKEFMMRHGIPTAPFITADSATQAISILKSGKFGDKDTPVVVKADGLAAGKGVIVAANRIEAITAVNELMHGDTIMDKKATNRIILEQMLNGPEVSLLLFADGKNFALMPPARDYKRIGDNNTGANTGGMGTISKQSLLTESELQNITSKIIEPTLRGAAREGFPFRGILFLGIMLTDKGAKLIEYNVRFGDPEAQSILLKLSSDLVEICESIIDERLDKIKVSFDSQSSCCVIMAARGYPAKPMISDVIEGLDKNFEKAVIFHSGTLKSLRDEWLTNGGRVLGIAVKNNDLKTALGIAYSTIKEITWKGAQYRKDIGS